jgi:hypothetical protein
MRYAMLINVGPRARASRSLGEEEQREIAAGYRELNETPGVTPNELRLQDPEVATTVRVDGGKTVIADGPFVEIEDALDGWLIYEATDLDAAIELAAKIPTARMGGKVEIRPIAE